MPHERRSVFERGSDVLLAFWVTAVLHLAVVYTIFSSLSPNASNVAGQQPLFTTLVPEAKALIVPAAPSESRLASPDTVPETLPMTNAAAPVAIREPVPAIPSPTLDFVAVAAPPAVETSTPAALPGVLPAAYVPPPETPPVVFLPPPSVYAAAAPEVPVASLSCSDREKPATPQRADPSVTRCPTPK